MQQKLGTYTANVKTDARCVECGPHTIAKIAILKGYLKAWFRILGARRPGELILYVDGFAGPGHYRNHDEGSPLAALRALRERLARLARTLLRIGSTVRSSKAATTL